jgi:hypothetical protein
MALDKQVSNPNHFKFKVQETVKTKFWVLPSIISKWPHFAELGNAQQENVHCISVARQRGRFSRLVIMQWRMFSGLVVRQ